MQFLPAISQATQKQNIIAQGSHGLTRLKNSRLTLSVPAVFAADATEDIVSMTNPDRGTFKERKHTVKVAKERESSFI